MLSDLPVPSTSEPPPHCRRCRSPLPVGWAAPSCPRCLLHFSVEGTDPTCVFPIGSDENSLGDHDLLEEIARGGMGVVYRARQRRLGRIVAVKVLAAGEFASAEARRRFLVEAEAAARLQHPGIVAIHDVGESDGLPWLSMDFIAGGNLAALVREQPLPSRQAAEYVRAIAEAVQHAHDHGVLHRDLKPSNILLDPESGPRITDFGIARCGETGDLTRTGEVLGSPGYTAPEQALGGTADARTDVYGLGAMLYHLLTARPPFQGPTLDAIVLQLREADPLTPRRLNPSVPRDLETICLRCLRKEPADRYATAREVAEDLGRFQRGEAIHARPISAFGKTWRWCRRRPAVALLLALVVGLMGVVVVGSLAVAQRQVRLEKRAMLLAEARANRAEGLAGGRTRSLAALREAWAIQPSPELRNEAIASLALPEISLERTLAPGDPQALPPASGASTDGRWTLHFESGELRVVEVESRQVSARFPDFPARPLAQLDNTGHRLAVVRSAGIVTIYELPSGKILHTLTHSQSVSCLDWAGEILAVGGGPDRLIHIWDTATGQRLRRFSGHDSDIEALRFRPDGQELISLSQDSVLRVWHAARGVEILRLERQVNHRGPAWWNVDGTRLFCAREPGGLVDVFRFDWSRTTQVLAPGQDEPRSENMPTLTLSPQGDLAASVDETACRIWSLAGGRLVATFPKDRQEWMTAQFAGEGSLWLSGWNRALRRIPIRRARAGWPEFGEPIFANRNPGPLLVGARADGGALAMTANETDDATDRVEIFLPKEKRRVALAQRNPFCAALSPDGRWAVTGSFLESGAQLWSLPDGGLVKKLSYPELVLGGAFSDGGTILWLSGNHGVQRLSTKTWEPSGSMIAGAFPGFVISRDGLRAASLARSEVALHRTPDLAEIARLPVPAFAGPVGSGTLAFSGDGGRLALQTAAGSVVVWNLAALREELRAIGMEW